MSRGLKIVLLLFLVMAGGLIGNMIFAIYKWNEYRSALTGEPSSLNPWPFALFAVLAFCTALSISYFFFNLRKLHPLPSIYAFLIFLLLPGSYLALSSYWPDDSLRPLKTYIYFIFWLIASVLLNVGIYFSNKKNR